jgi:RNA recognition motif-containing protein
MEIYIGNLSYDTDEAGIKAAFEAYGQVERVQMIKDKFTGRSKGFAFVAMNDNAQAEAAIQALHGTAIDGRTVTVNEARPREERPPRDDRGPSYGGGGGGGGGAGGGGRKSFDRDRKPRRY